MISQDINLMKGIIKESISSYIDANLSTIFLDLDMRKMIEALLNHVLEKNMSPLKELHSAALKELNQFDKRVYGKKYMSLISAIKKNLEVFKSLRADNLDDLLIDNSEVETLKTILLIIQEIYRKLEMKEQKMFQVVNQKGFSMETIHHSFEALISYEQIMDRMVENEEIIDCFLDFDNNKQEIIGRLTVSIGDEIRKAIMFSMQELSEASKAFLIASCQTVEYLKIAQNSLKELRLQEMSLPEVEKKILLAMVETLQLKYEAVKDKEYEYTLTKKEHTVTYEKQLLDFGNRIHNKVRDSFDVMLISSERPFIAAHESYNKLIHSLLEHNLKVDLSFLRTDLLSEMSTLEELVHHSLPKLEHLEHDQVRQAVKIILDCYVYIDKILNQSRIVSFEPIPHEKFNGKEHDAILVEENKGYQKGEVISVHTKGYRFEDFVILRANVTAAK